MRNMLTLLLFLGSHLADAASRSDCDKQVLRTDAFVKFIEAALKAGDLKPAEVSALAASPRGINPFLSSERTIRNLDFRKSVNRILPLLTAKDWKNVRRQLGEIIQRLALDETVAANAAAETSIVVTGKQIFSYGSLIIGEPAVLNLANGSTAIAFYENSTVKVRELPSGKWLGERVDQTSTVQGAKLRLLEPKPGHVLLQLSRIKEDPKDSGLYALEVETTDLAAQTSTSEFRALGNQVAFLTDQKVLANGEEIFFFRPADSEQPEFLLPRHRSPFSVSSEVSLKARDLLLTPQGKMLFMTHEPSLPRTTIHEVRNDKLSIKWSESSATLNDPYIFMTRNGRIFVYSGLTDKGIEVREPFAQPARAPFAISTDSIPSTAQWHETAKGDILLAVFTRPGGDNFLSVYNMNGEPQRIYSEPVGNAMRVEALWINVSAQSFLTVRIKDMLKIYAASGRRMDFISERSYPFSGAFGLISGRRTGYLWATLGRQKKHHVIELFTPEPDGDAQ